MTDIIIKGGPDDILVKDCVSFEPLNDGTVIGDKKYCNLSFQCRQVGMKSDYVEVLDPTTGEVMFFDYLCTGKKALMEERGEDEEAN